MAPLAQEGENVEEVHGLRLSLGGAGKLLENGPGNGPGMHREIPDGAGSHGVTQFGRFRRSRYEGGCGEDGAGEKSEKGTQESGN